MCTNGVKVNTPCLCVLKRNILVILQYNYCSVQMQHWSTKSTLFSHIIPAAIELGGSIGGFSVLYHKWSRVQCFPEAEEGENIRAAALRSATQRPWTRNWSTVRRCFTASLSCSCQRSNLAGPPLDQKWSQRSEIISHLLGYYKKNWERQIHSFMVFPFVGKTMKEWKTIFFWRLRLVI